MFFVTLRNFALGVLGALIGSVVVALLSTFFVGWVQHPLEAVPWLFPVSCVPCGLGGIVLGRTKRSTWVGSILIAFGVTLVSSAAGAPVVESFRRGASGVNISGYIVWSPVYAIGLLPILAPITHAISLFVVRKNS